MMQRLVFFFQGSIRLVGVIKVRRSSGRKGPVYALVLEEGPKFLVSVQLFDGLPKHSFSTDEVGAIVGVHATRTTVYSNKVSRASRKSSNERNGTTSS